MNVNNSVMLLLLLLSHFSRVRLCVTPQTVAHQALRSLGFSRQEHWSGLPFPSLMHESEKWKWSRSVVSDSSRPHGLQPTRLLRPWDSQAGVLEWGAIAFSYSVMQALFFSLSLPCKETESGSLVASLLAASDRAGTWILTFVFVFSTPTVRG